MISMFTFSFFFLLSLILHDHFFFFYRYGVLLLGHIIIPFPTFSFPALRSGSLAHSCLSLLLLSPYMLAPVPVLSSHDHGLGPPSTTKTSP